MVNREFRHALNMIYRSIKGACNSARLVISVNFTAMGLLNIITVLYLLVNVMYVFAKDNTVSTTVHEAKDELSRVKIKVFRGPTIEEDGEEFAPWGFWVQQPSGSV